MSDHKPQEFNASVLRVLLRPFLAAALVLGPVGVIVSLLAESDLGVMFFGVAIGTGVVAALVELSLDLLLRIARASERTADAMERLTAQQKRRGGS